MGERFRDLEDGRLKDKTWRLGERGAEAPEGKVAELPSGREVVEGLSRHRAKSNLNFQHLTLSSKII